MADWKYTESELAEQFRKAGEAGAIAYATQPRAVHARYDAETDRMVIVLQNGWIFGFRPWMAQGLRGANPDRLNEVEITPAGDGLHWETLDADLTIMGLMQGYYGSRRWIDDMAKEFARRGGKAKSAAKAAAARENGKKGGRPKKKQPGSDEQT